MVHVWFTSWLIVDEGDEDNKEVDVDVESPIENHWAITEEGQLIDKCLVPEVGALPKMLGILGQKLMKQMLG